MILNINKKSGFMMVEVMVVVAIVLASVFSVMSVAQKSVSVSRQSLHVSQASLLLEEGAEIVRILRDNSWDNISDLDPAAVYYANFSNSWSLTLLPSTIGIYTRNIKISNVKRDGNTGDISDNGIDDPNTKLFTISVSWKEGGVSLTKDLSFYITNIFS